MATRSIWRPMKDEVVADQGAVTALHPLASEAGVEVLRQGGNAIDATVAMGFCLAVVEPMMSCIAGHGQMLVHMDSKTVALELATCRVVWYTASIACELPTIPRMGGPDSGRFKDRNAALIESVGSRWRSAHGVYGRRACDGRDRFGL